MNKKDFVLSAIMSFCLLGYSYAGFPPSKEHPIIVAAKGNVKMRKLERAIWALSTVGSLFGAGLSAKNDFPNLTDKFLWGAGISTAMTLNAHFNVKADERLLGGFLETQVMANKEVSQTQQTQLQQE